MKKLILVLALFALTASPALADRSIAGSYVNLIAPNPAIFVPGQVYICEFYVYNGSVDVEWLAEVWFLFPECFHVLSGWYTPDPGASGPWNFLFDTFGNPDNGALFYDADGGWGEVYGAEGGTFFVEVMVGTECECGPDMIQWFLQGDIYGDEPHELTDYIDIQICDQTGAEESSWSTLKALY